MPASIRRRVPRAHRLVATAVVVALLLAACGTGPPDHVRIGLVAPQTGPRAFIGQEMVAGARMAVADLNDAGGLLGADVELVTVDDAELVDLPGQLADLAERARVSAVVGPEAPGALLGDRSPLSRRGVPALLPSAFSGDLDEAATFVGRTVPSARAQVRALGGWLTAARGIGSVAVLLADPLEGAAARRDIERAFDATGVEVAALVEAPGDATDLGPAVARLRDRAPDAEAVLLWGPPPSAARSTLAVRALDWDVQVLVPASSFVSEYRTLTEEASEGVVLAFPFRREWFGPELTRWMARYHFEHGLSSLPQLRTLVLDVPVVAAATYDAVQLVAAAVEDTASRVPAAVAEALPTVRPEGLLRTYDLHDREAWAADALFAARFHHLGVVFDVDPRMDAASQRRFWELQVSGDILAPEAMEGPLGELVRELLAERDVDPPAYAPPLPPPGPVARPGEGGG